LVVFRGVLRDGKDGGLGNGAVDSSTDSKEDGAGSDVVSVGNAVVKGGSAVPIIGSRADDIGPRSVGSGNGRETPSAAL
jgi:hypothetical protein